MKNRLNLQVETSDGSEKPILEPPVQCRICFTQISPYPGFLYQLYNQAGSAALFIQLCNHGVDVSGKKSFSPVPICIPCVARILNDAVKQIEASKEPVPPAPPAPAPPAPAPDVEPPPFQNN